MGRVKKEEVKPQIQQPVKDSIPSQPETHPPFGISKEMTLDEITARLYMQMKTNPFIFFLWYFEHHVRKQSPKFHLDLIREAQASRYLAVAAPRESAKSTILTFLKPFHAIMFQERRFIVIVQNTFKKAAMSLDSIKKELQENKQLVDNFPGIQIIKDAEGDSIIKHPSGFKTQILCKGVDQIGSIRGVKFGAYRPDLIIGDDMEDDELVRSPERRAQLQQDFDEALIPCGDKGNCQYIFIGTILHDDALIAKLTHKDHYPEYKKLFYKAGINWGTAQARSLWPEQWTLDDLKKLERDKPSVFAKEYQNDPVAGRNSRFKKEDFRYWKIENGDYFLLNEFGEVVSKGSLKHCLPAIACDLAWKEKRESDNCVILPAYLTPNSEILVEEYIAGKGIKPDEVGNHIFLMAERLEKITGTCPAIGFEKSMLENVTKWFLKQEMRKRNKFLITKELTWDADKLTRITTRLEPRYSQHVMFHKKGMGDLEHQLTRFPHGAHDDLCFERGTKIATLFGLKNIEEIVIGDLIFTPLGIRRVIESCLTGKYDTINLLGLKATPNHPIFTKESGFVRIDSLQGDEQLSYFNFQEILRWRYKKLLLETESNTTLWGRESITYLQQKQIKDGRIPKDFMWQFGKRLIRGQFLKAIMFIIKMAILLTTLLLTWSVFQLGNTIVFLKKLIVGSASSILKRFVLLQRFGIGQKVGLSGTVNTVKNAGKINHTKLMYVNHVEKNLNQEAQEYQDGVPVTVTKNLEERMGSSHKCGLALFVSTVLQSNINTIKHWPVPHPAQQLSATEREVYNLTIERDGCYYANGILVSNCDALQGVVQLLQFPKGVRKDESEDSMFDQLRRHAIESKRPKKEFMGFGNRNINAGWRIPARKTFF